MENLVYKNYVHLKIQNLVEAPSIPSRSFLYEVIVFYVVEHKLAHSSLQRCFSEMRFEGIEVCAALKVPPQLLRQAVIWTLTGSFLFL